MILNKQKIESVLKLTGPKRYAHFVKVVADQRKVWGLYSDGWALAVTNEGESALVLWPAREYAELCALGEWASYKPREIDLERLFEEIVPKLQTQKMLIGIFPTPSEKGVIPGINLFIDDIKNELNRIE